MDNPAISYCLTQNVARPVFPICARLRHECNQTIVVFATVSHEAGVEPYDLRLCLAVRRVLSGPGRDGYLRLNPGRPGASMRFSVSSAPHGRSGRRSTAAAVAPSGNGRETELAASLMAGDRRNLEEGPLSEPGRPLAVRRVLSGLDRISSTQPWSTRCLRENLNIASNPWKIHQMLHRSIRHTVGKRSGN